MAPGKHIPIHRHLDSNTGGILGLPSAETSGASPDTAGVTSAITSAVATHEAEADPHTGYVKESLIDAKGDLISGSAADTPTRTAVGTDGQYLKADSGAAGGLSWDSPSGSGAVGTDTIWDAKGDLAAGTGADTAAKLAVGANDTVLMADSTQSTGLKWVPSQTPSTQVLGDSAAEGTADTYARGDHKHAITTPGTWTDWTPAVTADSGDPTLGSGSSVLGRYIQIGKLVFAYGRISFGTSGVAAGTGTYEINYPVAAATPGVMCWGSAILLDNSANDRIPGAVYFLDSGEFRIVYAAGAGADALVTNALPWTWAASDVITFNLVYEAA